MTTQLIIIIIIIIILTAWCRVLLEKLTGLQLVKKFPAFHGTRRFITALITTTTTTAIIIIIIIEIPRISRKPKVHYRTHNNKNKNKNNNNNKNNYYYYDYYSTNTDRVAQTFKNLKKINTSVTFLFNNVPCYEIHFMGFYMWIVLQIVENKIIISNET